MLKNKNGDMTPYNFQVTVESLPNEKGFIPLGRGNLQLDSENSHCGSWIRTWNFPIK